MTAVACVLIGVGVGYALGCWHEAAHARQVEDERIRLARNRLRSGR